MGRGDGDRIAGVNAHRIEVLDGTDNDDVVRPVAHHFQLELFPADDRLFDEDFVDGAELQAVRDQLVEFLAVVSDAAASAAERETRPQHARQTDRVPNVLRFGERAGHAALRHSDPDLDHRFFEFLAVFGLLDGRRVGPDHLNLEALQHAVTVQIHSRVEARLAAKRRQERFGPFSLDDLGDDFPSDRLDVGAVGRVRVCHDRGRVGVHQHDRVALFAEGLARLGAGIIELAGLADDDGA